MPHILNLLPVERRTLLERNTIITAGLRLMKTLLLALFILTAGGAGLGATMQILSSQKEKENEAELEQQVKYYIEWRNTVTKKNTTLQTIDRLGKERRVWSEWLTELLSAIPPSAHLESAHGGTAANETTLVINGQTDTRNTLVDLDSALKSLPWIASVDAPLANLVPRFNPTYTFTLHLR